MITEKALGKVKKVRRPKFSVPTTVEWTMSFLFFLLFSSKFGLFLEFEGILMIAYQMSFQSRWGNWEFQSLNVFRNYKTSYLIPSFF